MKRPPKVLATDLDGTLIPLAGNRDNETALTRLQSALAVAGMELVFVTGRHFASVEQAVVQHQLPMADWIICDVGTSIYRRLGEGGYQQSTHYVEHLQQIVGDCSIEVVAQQLASIGALRPQEPEKQGRFKLSYYCETEHLTTCVGEIDRILLAQQLPYSVIASIDPFEFVGLIDLLPKKVSKAYALEWWSGCFGWQEVDIIFAGDSGNDSAALGAGYHAIVVGNAAPEVLAAAMQAHAAAGLRDRIYAAKEHATSGVLSGLLHYMELHR